MSARERLVELVLKNEPDYGNTMFVNLDGYAMTAEEMKGSVLLWLDAYRAEVLREAAAAQWAASPWGPERTDCTCNLDYCEACDMRRVIDLIDPDAL